MARIRSIKPEFWTSPQVVECSPTARLLFIGMWTFCDDSGVHPYDCRRLKMQVFPGDDIPIGDITTLVGELIDAGLLISYQVANVGYLRVSGWKHQRIEKPSFKYPLESGQVPPAKGGAK